MQPQILYTNTEEYNEHYAVDFTSQTTLEITGGKSIQHPFFNVFHRLRHTNIFNLLQKIFSLIPS